MNEPAQKETGGTFITEPAGKAKIAPALEKLIGQIKLVVFDFDGVFTDNTVYVSEDGKESVRCWRSDGIGLRKLDKLGIASAIISTEANNVVVERSKKLHIRCIHNCSDKLTALNELADELRVKLSEIAFVGNDINDSCVLKEVALPIVVADAHEDVVPLARLKTSRSGGFGAVREVCDLFERVLSAAP